MEIMNLDLWREVGFDVKDLTGFSELRFLRSWEWGRSPQEGTKRGEKGWKSWA